jgi:glycosyltransferase involved in cell wall biosynthesis
VKSVNGVRRPDRVAEIEARIGGDPRIHHLDAFLDRDGTYGLLSVADCYVSLHRAEGLGLGLAEAMLLRKPAIATAYSGNLEFMSESNSLLVDYSRVSLRPGDYLYDDPAFSWAEPDVDDAARKMRRVADDATLRARLAAEGPAAVRRVFDRRRSAALLRARLADLGILPA